MNSVPQFDVGAVLRARQAAMDLFNRFQKASHEVGARYKFQDECEQALMDTVMMADMLLRTAGIHKDAVSLREGIIYSIIKSNKTAQAAE